MRHELRGSISSAGFASGDRVVVGHWFASPIGPFTDVMWAEPDGARVLYVGSERAGAFVSSVYRFDRVDVVALRVRSPHRRAVAVSWDDRSVQLFAARGVPFVVRRPLAVTRWIEAPIARRLLGVETYGVSPTGVREWYQAEVWRPLRHARARIGERDLGAVGAVRPATGFGFSEPPPGPSMVDVRSVLDDASGSIRRALLRPADPATPPARGREPGEARHR